MKSYTIEEVMEKFITVLCNIGMSKTAIHGISKMLWGNTTAMDQVITFIEKNPKATESQIIKAASQAVGIK